MKGYAVGSRWWWERADGNYTQVTVKKSRRSSLRLRADISGLEWDTKNVGKLTFIESAKAERSKREDPWTS